jgi:hypothetical protein
MEKSDNYTGYGFNIQKMPPKKFYGDKIGSTFWWRMYFERGTRFNAQGVELPTMDGYSKDSRNNEPLDQGKCFADKVIMLWTNNGRSNGVPCKHSYFKHSEKIEFYKKSGFICNKSTDPLYITLFQDRYEIPPNDFATFDNDVRIFLNNFYKGLKGEKPIKHLIPTKLQHMDDLLNKTGHQTWEDVMKWADKIKNAGHPPGAINGYVLREMEKLHKQNKL